jgi:DNA-binding IclR family transcriptional regulator
MAHPDKSDSSLSRMLTVLDLFNEQQTEVSAEWVHDRLQVSLPTSYRYLKILSQAGLLRHTHEARYTLGPRIVVLDHLIRQADPILKCCAPHLQELAAQTGLDCVISGWHGEQMLDTHREFAATPVNLSFGRGRPRPLFLGAAPKVILAGMGTAHLRRLMQQHLNEVADAGLPTAWPAFRSYFSRIRKAGFYHSKGELEPQLDALAVPLQNAQGVTLAALSVVSHRQRMQLIDPLQLTQLMQRTARAIGERLA